MRTLLLLLLIVPMVFQAGCGRRDAFRSAYPKADVEGGVYRIEGPQALGQRLMERHGDHGEIWLRAEVSIRDLEEGSRDSFTARAMYREPDALRMSGSRMPVGTVFEVLILGNQAILHFPREGQMFLGTTWELSEKLGAVGGVEPDHLIAAVLIHQELRNRLAGGSRVTIRPQGDKGYLVASRDLFSQRQYFWYVRRADGLVEEVLVRSPGGREEFRVRYEEYRMETVADGEGEEPFPRRMTIYVPSQRTSVSVDVREYRLDRPLPTRAFEPPQAREVYPLAALQFEEEP